MGLIPFPGLFTVILSNVKISPFFISFFATMDFLATILFFLSEEVTILSLFPKDFSTTLIPSQSNFSSSGVTEAL